MSVLTSDKPRTFKQGLVTEFSVEVLRFQYA